MTEKELLMAFLSKTLNLDTNGVASLIYDDAGQIKSDALSSLEDQDAERVKSNKSNAKSLRDEGYQRAQREIMTNLEKDLKKKYGHMSELHGIELINEIIGKSTASSEPTLTEDDIKRHPVYRQLVLDKDEELSRIKAEAEDGLNKFKSEISRERVMQEVRKRAMQRLDSRNPVLSSDPTKAERQKNFLLHDLMQYEFDVRQDGANTSIIVLKDGKVLENKHGHPIRFESLVDDVSDSYFDFRQAEPRSSGGNPKPLQRNTSSEDEMPIEIKTPRSQNEWMKIHQELESNTNLSKEQVRKAQVMLRDKWKEAEQAGV
jgi:hypothetical protein